MNDKDVILALLRLLKDTQKQRDTLMAFFKSSSDGIETPETKTLLDTIAQIETGSDRHAAHIEQIEEYLRTPPSAPVIKNSPDADFSLAPLIAITLNGVYVIPKEGKQIALEETDLRAINRLLFTVTSQQ
jgi:hypothetical protein